MSSSGAEIVSTITGGIQDIAAILPLLGTEQCSEQVSSALTRGYLYAAASPMSIFGSLGVVRAGFKTLVACFSFRSVEGARILENMGFEPQGENLSLIMVEAGKGKNEKRYIIENRMDELIKERNIDKNRITGVSHKSAAWNVKMIFATALLCAFGITPYIYLNLGANKLTKSTRWVFPVLRATGGFITATLIQILIQRRITTLTDQYLIKRDLSPNKDAKVGVQPCFLKKYQMNTRTCQWPLLHLFKRDQPPNPDVEKVVQPCCLKKYQMDTHTWLLLSFLLIGLLASVVGYVGCFSVVQNSTSTNGPISWLCLEVGLSVTRLAIWAPNPKGDDAPPLEITLELDKYEYSPLPCNKDNEEILEHKMLPLTRARDFLKIITSFAGLIEPFSNPDLSLYYTLTRSRPREPEDVAKHRLGERILYITVFNHKERTTRVYTRENGIDTFYSTKSGGPIFDVGLEVEIVDKIDPKGDPVCSDSNNLDSLRNHHRSILEHIQYRLGTGNNNEPYAIENSWTMKVDDTVSALQRLKKDSEGTWKADVEEGKKKERDEKSLPIYGYFTHSKIEKDRQELDETRASWITRRMEMINQEMKERFRGETEGVEYGVNNQTVERKPTLSTKSLEEILNTEHYFMELLLLYEVMEWEKLFWKKLTGFWDEIGSNRVEEKERMTREWRANCRKRLNHQMRAAVKRVPDFPTWTWTTYEQRIKDPDWVPHPRESVKILQLKWETSIIQLCEGVDIGSNPLSLSEFKTKEIEKYALPITEESRLRIENEIEDTAFRLERGSRTGEFNQFWELDSLFNCRYSRSKWINLWSLPAIPPTLLKEVFFHALKGNRNIINITFMDFNNDIIASHIKPMICELPWVTSISFKPQLDPTLSAKFTQDLPGPLYIESTNNDLIKFANEFRPELDPDSTYIFADGSDGSRMDGKFLISFVAPTSASGQDLILRVKHSGEEDGPLEVTLGSTIIHLNPLSKSSLTIDDIILYPDSGPSDSDHLSFEPGIRNEIVIQFKGTVGKHGHVLHDLELLDEAGQDWRARILKKTLIEPQAQADD